MAPSPHLLVVVGHAHLEPASRGLFGNLAMQQILVAAGRGMLDVMPASSFWVGWGVPSMDTARGTDKLPAAWSNPTGDASAQDMLTDESCSHFVGMPIFASISGDEFELTRAV